MKYFSKYKQKVSFLKKKNIVKGLVYMDSRKKDAYIRFEDAASAKEFQSNYQTNKELYRDNISYPAICPVILTG